MTGSGKSTWAKEFSRKRVDAVIVSRDAIRFSLVKEDEEYFSKEKEVFKTYAKMIRESLANFDEVICDATHIDKKSREKLFKGIGLDNLDNVKIIYVYFVCPLEKAIERNSKRAGSRAFVPVDVIERFHKKISSLSVADLLKERCDEIYIKPFEGKIINIKGGE